MAEMSEEPFFQPEVQQAYDEYDRQVRINQIRIWAVLCSILLPAGITLDYFVYPEKVLPFLKLRLFCSLLSLLIWALLRVSWGQKHYRLLGLVLPLLPTFFIVCMIYSTEGVTSPYYAGLNLVLLAVGVLFSWTYLENLLVGVLVMVMYAVGCLLHGSFQLGGIFFNNVYFLVLTDVIVITSSYFLEKLRLREFAARFELDRNKRMLEESNRKLVEMDQVKSRFFANISHELRTPLTLLIAPLDALQAQAHLFDEAQREILKTMQGNAMRLLKLINDLLDLVKLESGKMEVRKEPLEIGDFMRGLIQAVQGVAKDKRVQLSSIVEESLNVILADRDKLEKIILNLLFNSIKFTSAGGKVEILAQAEGEFLALKVKDTGMGISEQNLPHIFDRFWQADGSAQRKYQGTGIGLALVKELTEAQDGKVIVESQLGKGTTMTVMIPLEHTEGTQVPAAGPVDQEVATANVESPEWLTKLYRRAELFPSMTPLSATLLVDDYGRGKRPKVLIVDDEPDMLRFLKTQLGKHYEILEAVDGNQAVEKARQFLPDLVVMDMMMPEKDGVEACRELKSLTSTKTIPIILLTARADDETKIASLNAGASDFLTKPFSTTELHVRVKNLVESHRFQMDLARQKNALESTLEQLKETESQLVQNEKMASLGRLSAGIIHEINNPLNYATSALYLLKMKKDLIPEAGRAKYVETVSDIEEGVGRVQRIVSDLRTFTHPHSSGKDWVNLAEILSTSLRFLSQELKDKIELEVRIPKDQKVMADRNKLIQVFVNLVQNSADALKEKKFGEEKPRISIKSQADNSVVRVYLRDNGAGIAPDDMGKIFDPFFTTKEVGQGMGLGLSICYKIMHEQGGDISVKSEKGKFTEFALELPSKA